MLRRHALFLLFAGLLLPGAARAAGENCGCGPKANPKVRAEQLYQMALSSKDLDKRRRLAKLALQIDPAHTGAQALLAESQ